MLSKFLLTRNNRKCARAPALISNLVFCCHTNSESRPGIEEVLINMIVVEHNQDIRLLLQEPLSGPLNSSEQRLPRRFFNQTMVVGVGKGGSMRATDASDDFCHDGSSQFLNAHHPWPRLSEIMPEE